MPENAISLRGKPKLKLIPLSFTKKVLKDKTFQMKNFKKDFKNQNEHTK